MRPKDVSGDKRPELWKTLCLWVHSFEVYYTYDSFIILFFAWELLFSDGFLLGYCQSARDYRRALVSI